MLKNPLEKLFIKKNKNLTLLIIPDAKKEASRLSIPWWAIYSMTAAALTTSIVGLYFTFNYFNLKAEIQQLEIIRQVNQKQAVEISSLKSKTEAIQDKLKSVEKLDQEVRAMVGLKEAVKESTTLADSQEARRDAPALSSRSENSNFFAEMEAELDEIQASAEVQSVKLADLKKDVEKRLDYLEAMPNLWPAKGPITDGFGYRKSPFGRGREYHEGIDINGESGDPVVASGSGTVVYAGRKPIWGNIVVVNHGYGFKSYYAHNSALLVKEGEQVKKGQVIAKVGSTGRSTGSHLDFRIEKNGQFVDPLEILSKK